MTFRNLAIFLLIPLLVLIVYIPRLYNIAEDNFTGISQLLTDPSRNKLSPDECQQQGAGYFPILAACLNYSIQNDTNLGHRLVDIGYREFQNKSTILDIYLGRLFWKEGNYSASCEKLMQAGDYLDLQSLAQAALDQENWFALETYLGCIGAPANDSRGLSSPRISVLFHNLGIHLEQVNQAQEALWAYQLAIEWYPTVWASPVLAAARIMEESGLRQDAESLVSHNYELAELPWSKFNLGLQLGKFMEEGGNQESAYCIYLIAQQAGNKSPAHLVPEELKTNLQERITSLEKNYHFSPEQCKPGE